MASRLLSVGSCVLGYCCLPCCHSNLSCRLREWCDHVLLMCFCFVDDATSFLGTPQGVVDLPGRAVVWRKAHTL